MAEVTLPYTLVNATTADANQVQANDEALRDEINGGLDGHNLAVSEELGLSETGVVRRGKSIVATEESRTNVAYGTLTTPDQVANVVVPTDGLLWVNFRALVKTSVGSAGSVALFIGANQAKTPAGSGAPGVVAVSAGSQVNDYNWVYTGSATLASATGAGDATSVTTGLIAATPLAIEVAAGTYTVSVQYLASSGSITAKERKLWVWTMGF